MSFKIDLSMTTDQLSRFHRQMIEPEVASSLATVRLGDLPLPLVHEAREQWAGRALASYYAMAQANDLSQRLITMGAPVEVFAGALQSLEDSYRNMVICAELSRRFENAEVRQVNPEHLVSFNQSGDPMMAIYKSALVNFGFNFTLSVPIFDALGTIATNEAISDVCLTMAASLEEDAEYGWALLQWLGDHLSTEQKKQVRRELPRLMAVFEKRCFGGPETLDALAGTEIVVEQGSANLGTLTQTQHAAIFYHTITETIFPRLDQLGFDASACWREHYRLSSVSAEPGLGVVAIDIVS
ncbi:MAG: hypothetical protein H0U74_03250 [Bradymonadaceae bacterium]|nr:hypothetical protein [Lujinxingiaceae bacterium]